jgi:putative oxidoreductase
MFEGLLKTEDNIGYLFARIALGIVILPHGLQKTVGMFGGHGFSGTVEAFVGMGMPAVVVYLIIAGESLGAVGLILGFLSRLAAFGIGLIMAGAIFMVHFQNGFFMNWFGKQEEGICLGQGFEYHILAIGLALVVLIKGAGKWSIDHAIAGD